MGNHLYDENRRLKAENESLREQLREHREITHRDDTARLVTEALHAFLEGRASLVSTPGHDPESRIMYFQMPPKKAE